MKKNILTLALSVGIIAIVFLSFKSMSNKSSLPDLVQSQPAPTASTSSVTTPIATSTAPTPIVKPVAPATSTPASPLFILENAPFTSQAPFGNWADPIEQNGCEEASALMAISWARGQTFTKDEALKQIIASSDYTLKKYGAYLDVSAQDTVNWIIKDFFNYPNAEFRKDIKIADIISELKKGNVVITPMNGQILPNPNYTAPGPGEHMLLIRGYDEAKNQFITNDPGTRKGELFRYDIPTFYAAIRDYPSGFKEPNSGRNKNMIVVWK